MFRQIPKLESLIVTAVACFVVGSAPNAQDSDGADFTMVIQDAFTISGRGVVLTGQVRSGSLVVGDVVCVPLTNGERSPLPVTGIELFRQVLDRAETGDNVGVLVELDNARMVETGAVLHTDC